VLINAGLLIAIYVAFKNGHKNEYTIEFIAMALVTLFGISTFLTDRALKNASKVIAERRSEGFPVETSQTVCENELK
jgi:hypothetical protein